MLHSEFTKLAGFQVEENYYHCVIEPEYNRSQLDKAEWVKQWKKDGGIQKAYDAQVSRYEDKAGEVERLREMNDNQQKYLVELREQKHNLSLMVDKLQEERQDKKVIDDALAYFLLEVSEDYSSPELREKVIEIIGFKAYIDYKFKHGKSIWQSDREEIMKHL